MGVELTDIMSSDEEIPFDFDPFQQRKAPSKEQRTYGIWAKDNDDDNDTRGKKLGAKHQDEVQEISSDDDMLMRAGFNPLNTATPAASKTSKKGFMNFVSGGIKQGSQPKKDYDPVSYLPGTEPKEDKEDESKTKTTKIGPEMADSPTSTSTAR